ncbi:MAG: polyphosphate polymerase domain-containing protein [Colwellia sp.]
MNQMSAGYDEIFDKTLTRRISHNPSKKTFFKEEDQGLTMPSAVEKSLESILNQFDSYGLDDLDNAKLMNRVDSKFILPISFLPELLSQLTRFYSILEVNNKRVSTYHNQYFDTPYMSLYHNHHNGKLNRYKVRRRHYVDTDTKFLEVKFKNNQKRTIKSRIKLTGNKGEHRLCSQFIQAEMNDSNNNLDISQQSGYQRIALANEAQAERLTLDFGLWFQNRRGNNKIQLPGFFIAELKQAKKSKRSPFYQLMSANNIFPTSFSKYCIGCALLYKSSLKTNRFKATLSRVAALNKIQPTSLFKSN